MLTWIKRRAKRKMKALQIQKQLNKVLAAKKPNYLKAFELYNKMNDQRLIEGLPFLKLPNLENKVGKLPLESVFNYAIK